MTLQCVWVSTHQPREAVTEWSSFEVSGGRWCSRLGRRQVQSECTWTVFLILCFLDFFSGLFLSGERCFFSAWVLPFVLFFGALILYMWGLSICNTKTQSAVENEKCWTTSSARGFQTDMHDFQSGTEPFVVVFTLYKKLCSLLMSPFSIEEE